MKGCLAMKNKPKLGHRNNISLNSEFVKERIRV